MYTNTLLNGTIEEKFENIDLNVRKCVKDDFVIDKDYFHNNVNYEHLYCVDDLNNTFVNIYNYKI